MWTIKVGKKYARGMDRLGRIVYSPSREHALSFKEREDAIHFCMQHFDLLPDWEVTKD